jgi:hypothetical protein
MKLRVKGNSLRLRLTRPEVMRLRDDGLLEESVGFGEGEVLTYRLRCAATPGPLHAAFYRGTIEVTVSSETARSWAVAEEVGLYAQAGGLQIAIEKDFRCLTRPSSEEPDAYPNPAQDSRDRS